jgi:tetratricopeptide (TPR) repeat protein
MKRTRLFLGAGVFTLLLTWTVTTAQAQSYYEIEGVVEGPNANALSGIAVFLEDLTRARIGQAITSSDGRYHFSRVGAGTYYIVVNPNDKQFKAAAYKVELINTATVGTNSSVERLDIILDAIPRRHEPGPGIVFAQDVPAAASARFEHAMESVEKKNTEQAIKELNEALSIFPNYFMASQQLGLLYVETEQYRQAIPLLVKAIEINSKAGSSYFGLGVASFKLGRADLALDALQRARPLDEKSFRVHFYLGLALLDLNRLDEAESSLKESYKLGGASKAASAHLYLAQIYSKRGQNNDAISELEDYLRDNPKAGNAASVHEAINKLKAKL